VGNPNSGKTTLFNGLTGLRQKVGNYAGVTVERKEGICYSQHGKPIRVIDLPGSYSLSARSPDERIMVSVLLGHQSGVEVPDGIVCVVDASNLERNLYLATQVVELGRPTIIALNMVDVAEARGIRIDVDKLSERLGCVVVPCSAASGKGILELRMAMSRSDLQGSAFRGWRLEAVREAVEHLTAHAGLAGAAAEEDAARRQREAEAFLALTAEDGEHAGRGVSGVQASMIAQLRERLDATHSGWRNELITDRYVLIGEIVADVVNRFDPGKVPLTERLDRMFLHPVWGFGFLGLVMGALFYSIFRLASPFMDAIDRGVAWLGDWVSGLMVAGPLHDLVVDGIIGGVGGVVIFLPQILMLFFFIGLLESTGYMARAAFILDRAMSKVGLHGRSFIPLLSSYACAVPGIMATRTIESTKDRLVTILVAPFMTCSARLPVYLVMIAAFLPSGQASDLDKALMLLFLYAAGTVAAFLFALLFKKTLVRGATPNILMELPPYRLPRLRHVFLEMVDRAKIFIRRAGTVIFGLSILLWAVLNYPQPPEGSDEDPLAYSAGGRLGQMVEPVFEPLGYDWTISVGILASFAAREVFVSTMAIIYHAEDEGEDTENLVSILRSQTRPDGSALFTPLTCLSILTFFVFALQCVSTVAVVKRETNSWRWPIFQVIFMFVVAWGASAAIFQVGRLLGFA